MPSVRKQGETWQARWKLSDGKFDYKSNRYWLKRDALAYAREQEQLQEKRPGLVRETDVPTFTEYADKVIKTRHIAATTRKSQESLWVRVEAEFGHMRLTDIRTRQIRAWIRDLENRDLSPSTIKQLYGLVKQTMDNAVADDFIVGSPCVAVKLPPIRRTRDAASIDEVSRFADIIDPRYRAAVLFMAATGARVGETMALTVSDVTELPIPQASITKSVTKNDAGSWVAGDTKTEAAIRTVAIPDWCWAEMQRHITRWQLSPDAWLFPAPQGGLLPPHRFRARYWNPARRQSGINITPHQLRHLQASILIGANRPDTELAARLGHANSRITHAVYSHWLNETDEEAAAAVPDMTQRETG